MCVHLIFSFIKIIQNQNAFGRTKTHQYLNDIMHKYQKNYTVNDRTLIFDIAKTKIDESLSITKSSKVQSSIKLWQNVYIKIQF